MQPPWSRERRVSETEQQVAAERRVGQEGEEARDRTLLDSARVFCADMTKRLKLATAVNSGEDEWTEGLERAPLTGRTLPESPHGGGGGSASSGAGGAGRGSPGSGSCGDGDGSGLARYPISLLVVTASSMPKHVSLMGPSSMAVVHGALDIMRGADCPHMKAPTRELPPAETKPMSDPKINVAKGRNLEGGFLRMTHIISAAASIGLGPHADLSGRNMDAGEWEDDSARQGRAGEGSRQASPSASRPT